MSLPDELRPALDNERVVRLAFQLITGVCESPQGRTLYARELEGLHNLLMTHCDSSADSEAEESLIFVPGVWPNDTGV